MKKREEYRVLVAVVFNVFAKGRAEARRYVSSEVLPVREYPCVSKVKVYAACKADPVRDEI